MADLEEHVKPDWWRRIFNSMYLKTDGDVVDDPRVTSRECDLFAEILKLSGLDSVLDLCCGQGRTWLELARRGFVRVEGLDRSRYLIRKARARAKKQSLPDATEKPVVECCLKLSDRLECGDCSRFDWRMDSQGNPRLVEVSPNPWVVLGRTPCEDGQHQGDFIL